MTKEGKVFAEYVFSDHSKMMVIESFYEKNVKGTTMKYASPRVKYFDEKGVDKKYGYCDFYRNCDTFAITYATTITGKTPDEETLDKVRDKICENLFRIHEIPGEGEGKGVLDPNKILEIADLDLEIADNGDFLRNENLIEFWRKICIGVGFGFYAEDNYLLNSKAPIRIKRDFNLAKYALFLVGSPRLFGMGIIPKRRLNYKEACVIWGKNDPISVEDKALYVKIIMSELREKYDPAYINIDNAWGGMNDTAC